MSQSPTHPISKLDIEHATVADDPRLWPRHRKNMILAIIAICSLAPTLGVNLYAPAITQIKENLHATSQEIALSLSLFIVVQGNVPLLWSAVSEIKGRKAVYITSLSLFAIGSGIGGSSRRMAVLISMRVLQAAGGSAVLAIGAGTLADIFDSHERGRMMGIYYAVPLLGPGLGPVLGGVLTQALSWRATFYCLAIIGTSSLALFFFFKETFRRERSHAYQAAQRRAIGSHASGRSSRELSTETKSQPSETLADAERSPEMLSPSNEVRLSLRDVNPIRPTLHILRKWNNIAILIPSGLLFAFQYSICYTSALTFSAAPYNLNPIKVGLVLLSFGLGNMAGSILGGRRSDVVLARLTAKNGGVSEPEMRLRSTTAAMVFLPLSVIAFAWLSDKKIHIAGPVVALFVAGFSAIWIYTSTLSYLVDANVGRSSTAIATNSSFRGIAGLVAAEIAEPLQSRIGDGGLYSLWAGLLVITNLSILLVIWKGEEWRRRAEEKESARA